MPFALRHALLITACILGISSLASAADGPVFVRPPYSVPLTSSTLGEGNKVLDRLSVAERQVLQSDGVLVSAKRGDESAQELRGVIRAYLVVKQPREKAFALLIEPSKQHQYLPRLASSKAISRTERGEKTEFLVKIALFSIRSRVIHQWWPEASRVAWNLDPEFKNDLRKQVGYYNVYSLDEHTSLLEFGTVLETSALVPDTVQDYLTRRDLPESLMNVKKYVDSGGKFTK